jgi:hypothetical protein
MVSKKRRKTSTRVSLTDAGETGMIGQGLVQIVAKIPAHTQPICRMAHQLPSGSNAFEKHHQLQFEEDQRINRRSAATCIALLYELAHKREIECSLEVAIEVILWY